MATFQPDSDRSITVLTYWRAVDRGWKATIVGFLFVVVTTSLHVPW